MKIKELLVQAVQYLKNKGVENNAVLDAQLILCHLLKVDKLYLTIHGLQDIDKDMVNEYMQLIEKRAEGMPVQYIIGEKEFMSLTFKVTKDVLIPRNDTETLVEYIIDRYGNAENEMSIMDIGTGSGCIAVSLAYYLKSNVTAVDISQNAIDIAKENAKANGVESRIRFIQHDILQGFPGTVAGNSLDVIVSNPPYIRPEVIEQLQREVKDYEPRLALDGGADGLRFYRMIIRAAHEYLKDNGLLAFEVGHDQSRQVSSLIEETQQYKNIEIIKDLAGIERVVGAVKKGI